MSHNLLAAQIARQASVIGTEDDFGSFCSNQQHSEAEYFRRSLEESGAQKKCSFLKQQTILQLRELSPRVALTVANIWHLIRCTFGNLTDMTNYAEAPERLVQQEKKFLEEKVILVIFTLTFQQFTKEQEN